MGKRKKTHLVEDQFGEGGVSQDKDFGYHGGNKKGPGGGGSAGGGTRGQQLSVTKHLPKFLQAHAHLLGSREQPGGHEQLAFEDKKKSLDDERDDDNQEEALLQAVEQNPELLQQFPELKELQVKKEAMEIKLKGNKAFKEKKYEEAVDLFSRCIQLDPRCVVRNCHCNRNCDFSSSNFGLYLNALSDAIYYSNRAAAYIELGKYKEAVTDGRNAVLQNPSWIKGYLRLGIALLRLDDPEASDVLERAKAIEPDHHEVNNLLFKANAMAEEQKRQGKHKFVGAKVGVKRVPLGTDAGLRKTLRPSALSFEEDE